MQREEPKALEESKNIQKPLSKAFLSLSAGFNAGGTADFILIISVPGYLSIPGLFYFSGIQHLKDHKGMPDAVRNTAYQGKEKEKGNW